MAQKHPLIFLCFVIIIFLVFGIGIFIFGETPDDKTPIQTDKSKIEVSGSIQNKAEIFSGLNGIVGAGIIFDDQRNMFVGVKDELVKISPDGKKTTFCSLHKLPKGKDYYFSSPLIWDMTFDNDHNILAAAQDRILKITPNGHIKTLIREDFIGFLGASGIELDQAGNIYITNGHKIVKYTSDFKKSTFIESGKAGDYYSFFSLEFDPDFKNLYVSDFHTSTLLKYPIKPDGTAGNPSVIIAEPFKNANGFGAPLNIICGSQGNIYVSMDGMSQILKIDKTGKTEFINLGVSTRNHIIAFGGKGFDEESIYFTTYDGLNVYKFFVGERTTKK